MAIYSLNLGFISRSAGRSSVGFSAYIGAARLVDERTGAIYNYDCKNNVVVSRVLAPEDAPDWVKNSDILWNKAEQFEDEWATLHFKNPEAKEQFLNSAQTAQTIMGAIPLEFSQLEAEACVEEFLTERFVSRGLVVEYAIHWDKDNPHFHGMITRRPLLGEEFSQRKDREIVSKTEHNVTRKQWEVVVNKHLELGGYEVRIDCRSFEDQGLSLLPTAHEGWYAQRLAEKGQYSRIIADNEAIRQKNIELICENPAALVHEVALKRTTFTRKHLEEEIIRRVGGDEKLFRILKAKVEGIEIPSELILKQSNENFVYEGLAGNKNQELGTHIQKLASQFTDQLLENKDVTSEVGENLNRDHLFTSRTYKEQEDKITQLADTLHQSNTKTVAEEVISKVIEARESELGFKLLQEQKDAITHLCSGPDICLLNGKAGTGKTTLLKAVAEAYQESGYRVLGTSFQGKAVEIMEQEIGIPCRTLDSLKFAWEKHEAQKSLVESGKLWGRPYLYAFQRMKEYEKSRFTFDDVIIVDEANMIGGRLWVVFLEEATLKGVKVLIVQDTAQIKSRDPGDYGSVFAKRFGFCETREVMRQRILWQKECSKLLNDHHVLDGLKPYYDKGHLTWLESASQVHMSLAQDYVKSLLENPNKSLIALAYRNMQVYEINQSIRQELKGQGYLQDSFTLHGEGYALGDRIRFTQNDHQGRYVKNTYRSLKNRWNETHKIGIKNGTFGTIESFDAKKSYLTVKLDDQRYVSLNVNEYKHITHGYAMSIHKSEGSTFDRSFVVLDPLMDTSTLLVSFTRHRNDVKAYINREQFIDFKEVVDKVSRYTLKDTLQDYHVPEDQKPYLGRVQNYRDLISEAATLREEMEGSLESEQLLYKHPSYLAYQKLFEEKKQIAGDILKDWDNHNPYVRLAGIRRDVLEVEAGLRPRLLSDLEHRASIQVQGYMDLVRQTRSLWKTISETHPAALSQSHPLYEDYKALKTERDSLAFIFQENLKLYTPFFKTTKVCPSIKPRAGSRVSSGDEGSGDYKDYWGETIAKENRVFISSIRSHAEAHYGSQLQDLYIKKLSSEEKEHYDLAKSYADTRNQAAAIYSHLQVQQKNQSQTRVQVVSPGSLITIEKFHELQSQRDALALKIVELPEKYQSYFEHFKIKEEKLLEHAVAGELREKVQAYASEENISKKATKAQELKRFLTASKDYRIFKEQDLDVDCLTFDIAFYEKVSKGDIDPKTRPEDIYKPIQSYLKASRELAKLWKTIKVQLERDKPIESHKIEWQKALKVLNENAHLVANQPAGLAIISEMRAGIATKIHRQIAFGQKPIHQNKHEQTDRIKDKAFSPKEKLSSPSVEHILQATGGKTELIIRSLLGEPNPHMSTKTALRYGRKGSFVMNIAGSKEGLWKDFESGEGGNLIQLIQREKRLSFKESVSYLADVLNVKENSKSLSTPKSKASYENKSLEAFKDRAQRLNAVLELQMKSKLIEGTVAETYLRKERGIMDLLASDLRYIPKGTTFIYQGERKTLAHHCLAAFGRDSQGKLSSVQLTKLDDQGKRMLTKEGHKLNKLQYGVSKGSFVTLQHDKETDLVFIAEGVETALSIKEAGVRGKIVASLGVQNISNYEGPEKTILLCADNDENKLHSQSHKNIEKSKEMFESKGQLVVIIKPTVPGDDFNDILKKEGIKGIQEYVKDHLDPTIQKTTSNLSELTMNPIPKTASQLPETKTSDQHETLLKYVDSKLKEIKIYEGTSIAHQAKKDLKSFLKVFEKNGELMERLKVYNPEIEKVIKIHLQKEEKLFQSSLQK